MQAPEQVKEDKQAHGEIETHHPGFFVSQDTLCVGYTMETFLEGRSLYGRLVHSEEKLEVEAYTE